MSAPRPRLRLGTRGSPLALWQAREVAARLGELGVGVETVVLQSSGDRNALGPLAVLDSRAPFADAIEEALRRGEIDVAVHSLKDLPLEASKKRDSNLIEPLDEEGVSLLRSPDLVVAALPTRGPVSESLVSKDGKTLHELPRGAFVGTSCARRAVQIQRLRADLAPIPIRGAVEQRVRQVREGAYDAAILATAGLVRLGLEHLIAETFTTEDFTPAPGQGALAVQVRAADVSIRSIAARLDDARVRAETRAELLLQRAFEPSESFVLAAAAHADAQGIGLFARLLRADGGAAYDARVTGTRPADVADAAAGRLREALERDAAA